MTPEVAEASQTVFSHALGVLIPFLVCVVFS